MKKKVIGKKLLTEAGAVLIATFLIASTSFAIASSGTQLSSKPVHLQKMIVNGNTPRPLGEDTISFYDKECEEGHIIGLGGEAEEYTFESAIRITPTELSRFEGWNLSAAKFYHYAENTNEHSGQLKVYDKGTASTPGTLLASAPFVTSETGWVQIDLSPQIELDITKDIWVSIEITHPLGDHPMCTDLGPAVDGKGDWAKWEGIAWTELKDMEDQGGNPLDWNWIIEAVVTGDGPSGTELAVSSISGGFGGVTASVTNAGESEAVEVNMSMTVQGGLLGLINKEVIVYQESLQPGASAPIESGMIFGLGKVTITVTAEAANADPVTKSATGFAFGPMILGVK